MAIDEDERRKCLAIGVLLGRSATDLDRDARDAAIQGEELELAASVFPRMGLIGRGRVTAEAKAIDELLKKAEACGLDPSGRLGGEFGRLEDWETSASLSDLATRAHNFHRAVYQMVDHELTGKKRGE